MTRTKEISNCCNAPVRAEWGDDFAHESKLKEPPRGVTVWHVCTKCKNACDTHPNVMDIGKEEQNDWQKTFRSFHNDNEEGGSSRWRVSPDVVQAFVQELLSQTKDETIKEFLSTPTDKLHEKYKSYF